MTREVGHKFENYRAQRWRINCCDDSKRQECYAVYDIINKRTFRIMSETPYWLTRRVPSLMRSGQLNLTNEKITDLSALASPGFARYLPMIKLLDVKGTMITSLQSLPHLPNITTFIADGSKLGSLRGFASIASASKVSLKNTPVAQYRSYKLSLLIICKDLVTIDNTMISKSLREKATDYPECAADLLDKGWIAETPCPDIDRFDELCARFDVETESARAIHEPTEVCEEEQDEFADFEAVCQMFRDRQDQMFALAEETFGVVAVSNFEAELADRISVLFGNHAIAVDATSDDLIVQAIEDLCIKATTMDNRTPSSLTEEEDTRAE